MPRDDEVMVARRFNVTKFKSYSPDVLGSLPDDKHERSTKHVEIDKKKQAEQTLGVSWRTIDDCFTFIKSIKQYTITKRGVLSTVCSIFHSLRFLAPFTLKAKLLIQSMWCRRLEWDKEIPVEFEKFKKDGYKEYLKSKSLK